VPSKVLVVLAAVGEGRVRDAVAMLPTVLLTHGMSYNSGGYRRSRTFMML